MADLATIRAAIKNKMLTVPDIGVVHDYERYAKRESEFRTLFELNGEILGWFFYRDNTAELDGDTGEVRRLHEWQFFGFKGLSDNNASAKSFQDLVEVLASAFRADPTLGGVIEENKNTDQAFGPVGLQIDAIETVMFASVLCHRARLRLVTETTEPK